MAFIDEFDLLMPHTLVVTSITTDGRGTVVLGSSQNVKCSIGGTGNKLVVDSKGNEAISSYELILDGVYGFNVEGYRYTLPSGFPDPRTNRQALVVETISDETGPIYQVVMI